VLTKEKKETLMIIDGSSLIHRAFYALPLLSTKDGIYTNGAYGFLTMLHKLKEDYPMDYICVVFDKKGPTFRHEAFEQYKANRLATPDELAQQFPIIKEILNAMNIVQLEIDGYEADDIAGTLSKLGEENNLKVILVTGDRDYLQLASNMTTVLLTKKGITELIEYDENKFIEEYGITPKQFIDLKGLMGDKSDNIPGVPGIGEKTGIKLLKEFGSIENIYENIDMIKGKLRDNLIENKTSAFLSKKLAEIIRTVPLQLSLEDLTLKEPDWEKLKELYTRFEFNSLLSKLSNDGMQKESPSEYQVDYKIVENDDYEPVLEEINASKYMYFKFLFEEEHYINSPILGIGIKAGEKTSYYIDFNKNSVEKFTQTFKQYFESEEIEKLGHMIKMDIYALLKLGINIDNIVFDSMIGKYLLNPAQASYSIDELAKEYLNINVINVEELLGKGKNKKSFKDLDLQKRAEYISIVLDVISKIKDPIAEAISQLNMKKLYYEVELPLAKVLAHMEYYGFKVDIDVLNQLGDSYNQEIEQLTNEIYELAGQEFNISSPKQLGFILFEKLNLPVIKKTKTGYSTDAEVLEKLKGLHEIVEKILRYRQLVKLKSTYIDGLLNVVDKETSKVYSTFNQTVTNTGRISSQDPNLQNIPVKTEEGKEIRKAFVPQNDEYVLVDADYSQIELRVLAHISQDPKLIEAFYNDEDIHTKTASQVFNIPKEEVTPLMRSRAKAVNFGIIYGISDYGLSRDLNIPRKEAKRYIDSYLNNYDKVKSYMDNIIAIGKELGYVETILNRRRYIPELKSRNFNVRSFGERIAMNTPIQGSAADIIKVAMVKVFDELNRRKLKSRLILQVHDELIIEAHKDELEQVKDIVKDIMENCIKLDVPLKVDLKVGDSWYEAK
jgi:DNA polymerase-1